MRTQGSADSPRPDTHRRERSRSGAGAQPEFETKGEAVQRLIRQRIAIGEIKPGERLLQNELADRLGISPTPVREALQALIAQGVLSYAPNKGVRVVELDYPAAEEVYRMRAALEPLAVEIGGPRLTPEMLDELAGALAGMQRAAKDRRLDRVKVLDHRFHFLIYDAVGAGRLHDAIEQLRALHVEDTFKLEPVRVDTSLDQHADILRALEEGRFADASALTREHITSAAEIVLRWLRSPEPNGQH
jgi:DNA-binding GntR family transcriptional regulator